MATPNLAHSVHVDVRGLVVNGIGTNSGVGNEVSDRAHPHRRDSTNTSSS